MHNLTKIFIDNFQNKALYYFEVGGRLEIIGNHTDHNHGLSLVANCNLKMYAVVNKSDEIIIISKGHEKITLDMTNLDINSAEYYTSKALVKGILYKLRELGYNIGGFHAYIESEIPEGSGLSSSASFEVLITSIINMLYNNAKIPNSVIAKVAAFSEQVYFNKPCGLLDQMGVIYPGINFVDFKDSNNPFLYKLPFNLDLSIFLVSSLGSHANLTNLYASIPNAMQEMARLFKQEYLRFVDEAAFYKLYEKNSSNYKFKVANHFFLENQNVLFAKEAIENNNIDDFLKAINKSGLSSSHNLENTYVKGDDFKDSPEDIIRKIKMISNFSIKGAIRIHGGGFKGNVIVFVKNQYKKELEMFLRKNYFNRFLEVGISNDGIIFKKI